MKNTTKRMLCIAVLLACCVLFAGCALGGAETENGLQTLSSLKDDALVVLNGTIATEWYECSYSQTATSAISVKKAETVLEGKFRGDLAFSVRLTGGETPLFDLRYNNDQGDWTIEFENGRGERIPVSFVMHREPEGLSEEDHTLFMMALESVNDVVSTLKLK